MIPTTSAFRPMIAATVFGHCRSNSAWLSAPRHSITAPPTPPLHAVVPNVLKKFRRFIAPTCAFPPTAGGVAGRGFAGWKFGEPPPSASIGRTRKALPLAALPAHVYVITPTIPVAVSPPRSVFDALSGLPPRPNTIGSTFWRLERVVDDDLVQVVLRLQRRDAGAPGATTFVGSFSTPPDDIRICPKRSSWKCSVTYSVCGRRTSIPSYRSGKSALANGSVTSVGVTVLPVLQTADVRTRRSASDPGTRTPCP